jgi:hypothetical protein
MVLKPSSIQPVPEETARIARAAFRKGNPLFRVRDELGAIFADADFADLFPRLGQPGLPPWRLALVTILQFRENLPDRQAAERVLATAHKAKGLEWPRVQLASDFPRLEELHALDQDGLPHLTPEERDQELHLLYVAVTRARQQLEPNATVRSCLAPQAELATARQGYAA